MDVFQKKMFFSLQISSAKVPFRKSKQLRPNSKLSQELSILQEVDYYKKHVKSFFNRIKSPQLSSFERISTSISEARQTTSKSRQTTRESISSITSDDSTDYRVIRSKSYKTKFLLEVYKGKTVEQLKTSRNVRKNRQKMSEDPIDYKDLDDCPTSSRFSLAVDYGVKF